MMNSNPNMGKIIRCSGCKKEEEHHAKGFCRKCYKKNYKQPAIKCKNCGKERQHKAFGLCGVCHIKIHHYDNVKTYNARKYHNISLELYRKITKKCVICGFDKIVDLHHLDENRQNNKESNLVGLCPNHHKMLHHHEHSKEVFEDLQKKGFKAKLTKL